MVVFPVPPLPLATAMIIAPETSRPVQLGVSLTQVMAYATQLPITGESGLSRPE
jgi:hypothetical protein